MEVVGAQDVMEMGPRDIHRFAKEQCVSLAGCKTVDQWRERLVLHLQVQANQHYSIQREFGLRRSESLDSTCTTLDNLLASVQDALADLDPTLGRTLVDSTGSDDTSSLLQQIQGRRNSLKATPCSVIVAGETNAGKSTLLNLLLGMDVLPTWIFNCTAAVCVLKYAATFSAEIVYHDSRRTLASFEGVVETRDWLEDKVAVKDLESRERGLGIDVINVHLPAIILQNGVTLVDTPGIGENEAMYNCAMDYVKRNSAAAYIYIIKTDNAGGVHDDRLLEFLRAILLHNQEDANSDVFDPSAAMFVCNRWDQVPEDQQDEVKENVLNKLKDVWPRFDPGQAFFVSATNAQSHVDADPRYVTEDYEELLRGMKDVFGKARHNAVNQHYRWLKHLLHQSSAFLQTTIHRCTQSDEDLVFRFRATKDKLEALQQRTADLILQLRAKVREEIDQLCCVIAGILHEKDVRQELLDWTSMPFPSAPTLGTGEAQRWGEEVDKTIMKRIMDKVDSEVTERDLDRNMEDSFTRMAQSELKLVDEEIDSILADMAERTSINSSVSSASSFMPSEWDDDPANEMLKMYRDRDGFRLANLRRVSRHTGYSAASAQDSEAAMASVPKVILRKLLGPLASLAAKFSRERRRSSCINNPVLFMKDRTDKLLRALSDQREFFVLMTTKYHDKLNNFITDVENSIPRFVATNTRLMEDIRDNRKSYLSRRNELFGIMEKLEPIREMLRGFGALYVRDVTADNINFMLDAGQRRQSVAVAVLNHKGVFIQNDSGLGASAAPSKGSVTSSLSGSAGATSLTASKESVTSATSTTTCSRTSQGLWSTYRWGHVAIGESKQHVIGRTYILGLKENCLIKEIAKLRCLSSAHLAPILGMSRMEDCAVFLFMGDLMSARRYLTRGFNEPRVSVPRVLEGVVGGLRYLHQVGLVHMELSMDTVMVNRDGEPKLCGACLPRHARFPPDAQLVDAAPFLCLSPEVLRGDLYTAEDDFYSLGLVVWETCLREKPFSEQRSLSLQEFRDHVHPAHMLALESHHNLSDNLTAVLRGCLLPARGLRIGMEELQRKVSTLSNWFNSQQSGQQTDQKRDTHDFPATSKPRRVVSGRRLGTYQQPSSLGEPNDNQLDISH